MADIIDSFKSHPDKKLNIHVEGVVNKTKELSQLKLAELIAIFHDVGKINPNFQNKVVGKNGTGYSNHAYLSAYVFWCYYCANHEFVNERFNIRTLHQILQAITLIAKHHSNLPNFIQANYDYSHDDSILKEDEIFRLLKFVNSTELPAEEFVRSLLPTKSFKHLIHDDRVQSEFKRLGLQFDKKKNKMPLMFFLETQCAFASLILADKSDAGNYDENDRKLVSDFCKKYNVSLKSWLESLNAKQDISINKLRTEIREEAVRKLSINLSDEKRIFTLTAPTGSGKTLMLLSLAGEIIRQRGDFRIIYALPFLSITEQVEEEVLRIFKEHSHAIQRIDSKSDNELFQRLQEDIETYPSDEKILELLCVRFREDTFAYPFVITTFVRVFETLLSNKNSTLLKLPHFANTIFLVDEIQALPPRLYSFLVAYLSEFCKEFNSYAIISTATMPYVDLPTRAANYEDIKELFPAFKRPIEISNPEYFSHPLFTRYTVHKKNIAISMDELSDMILNEKESVLVILNTIDDTKDIHELLCESLNTGEVILINTHITPNDRKIKIQYAKKRLSGGERIIMVSTQLIEAGVDIDFPNLYRDMAAMPSIIQSAGRCNRNGRLQIGKVTLFNLVKDGKERSRLIYRGRDQQLLNFTNSVLNASQTTESELFEMQRKYFEHIGVNLEFGKHYKGNFDLDFIREIKEAGFANVGSFQLIDPDFFGEEFICYIPENETDQNFHILKNLFLDQREAFKESIRKGMFVKAKIQNQLKKMSGQILQIRHRPKKNMMPPYEDKIFNIHLVSRDCYSFDRGLILSHANGII